MSFRGKSGKREALALVSLTIIVSEPRLLFVYHRDTSLYDRNLEAPDLAVVINNRIIPFRIVNKR